MGLRELIGKVDNWLFYKKECINPDGTALTVRKPWTMKRGEDYMHLDLVKTNGLDEYGKIQNDPRITPTGRIVRKFWIDELLQIPKTIFGEMCLFGFRPHTPEQMLQYSEPERGRIKKNLKRYALVGFNYAGWTLGEYLDLVEREGAGYANMMGIRRFFNNFWERGFVSS